MVARDLRESALVFPMRIAPLFWTRVLLPFAQVFG
jgi:hypothetical protein